MDASGRGVGEGGGGAGVGVIGGGKEEEQQYPSLKSLGSVTRCLTLILSLVDE